MVNLSEGGEIDAFGNRVGSDSSNFVATGSAVFAADGGQSFDTSTSPEVYERLKNNLGNSLNNLT